MPAEIQAFLEGLSVWTVIAWGAAAALVWGVVRKVWPLLKKLADFLDDVMGEEARPGVPARLGLMERVMRVEHELFPNSGKSLRDQTNRMEEKLDRDNARIDELTGRLDEHITKSNQIINKLTKES
ncbi:hypothetical protein [Microbacterium sp. NPDC057944]|uniref:hypothetical protein n=1 Tax=Microbacterium sp. NPDC057944 TaxID=3346286 RepID=UPI0036DC6845